MSARADCVTPFPGIVAGDRRRSHDQLDENARRAAGGFARLGLGAGDTVALFLRNDFAFFEASLAAGLIGAYVSPINWHGTTAEAGYVLNDCGARVLVAHSDLWPVIAPAVPPSTTVLLVPTPAEIRAAYQLPDDVAVLPRAAASWDDWVAAQAPLATLGAAPRASMIYTSGTTGNPKGVRRAPPTEAHLASARAVNALTFGLDADQPGITLMNGPMYHSAPNLYGLTAARLRLPIVLQARFDAEEMLALIERQRISHMHIVPTMFVRLLKLPAAVKARHDLSSLRFVVHGAAPCPPTVKQAMVAWWGEIINEYYGSTETAITCWHSSAEALRKPGTVGRPIPGATVRVLGDDGADVPPGGIGEIFMRAPHAPTFVYQGLPGKHEESIRDGLTSVGDVGWIDQDGYVYLCDRKRDMVISGGVNIYPAEIEAVLIAVPGVRDCAVFGIPDADFGERLCAHVELDRDAALTPDEIRAALARTLAAFKVPKVIEIAASLPREDSGKVFKRKLREPYWAGTGRRI